MVIPPKNDDDKSRGRRSFLRFGSLRRTLRPAQQKPDNNKAGMAPRDS